MIKKLPLQYMKRWLKPDFVTDFLERRIKKYFPGAKRIKNIEIELFKNFLNFGSLGLKYKLEIDFGSYQERKTIQARLRRKRICFYDNPGRHYLFLKYLWDNGFRSHIGRPLDYVERYNLLLYEYVKGENFQFLLAEKKINVVSKFIPKIADLMFALHHIKIKNRTGLPTKTEDLELCDYNHWLRLLKRYYPPGLNEIKNIIQQLNKIRKKYPILFGNQEKYVICHGDPHPGNFLKTNNFIKVVDFGDAYLYDSFDDLSRFLVCLESMIKFYVPEKFNQFWPKLYFVFIKRYFKNKNLSLEEKLKLGFFEIRNLVQMVANLIFLQKSEIIKQNIFQNLILSINKRLEEIKKYV